MIKGVLFDMDGVLFDTERLGLEGWKIAAKRLHIPIDDAFIARMRGRNLADSREFYQNTLGRDDYDDARAIRTAYADQMIASHGLPVKPGVYPLLEALAARNFPAALATSTDRAKAMDYLEAAHISMYFSAVVCGDEVAHAKPAPDIFLMAAGKLGLAPAHCLVIEDSPNGLQAAHCAGCIPVMVPDLTPPTQETMKWCATCVPDLESVVPLLDML